MPNSNHLTANEIDIALTNLTASNTKDLLTALSHHIAKIGHLSETAIFTRLAQKEKDQSSGTGEGIAIPHARLTHLDKPICLLATLKNTIDFNAPDNQPVDIICILLSPRTDGALHLQRLSKISRILKDKTLCTQIRNTKTDQELMHLLTTPPDNWNMAA